MSQEIAKKNPMLKVMSLRDFRLLFSGLGSALVGLSGYFFRFIRNAEAILPDHDQLLKAETSPQV
jgi:hypothetical protein